jgi:hypothetical protein
MRYINGFLVAVITTSLLSSACNSVPEQQQTAVSDPYANNAVLPDEDY